jgi:hypothetical protein
MADNYYQGRRRMEWAENIDYTKVPAGIRCSCYRIASLLSGNTEVGAGDAWGARFFFA